MSILILTMISHHFPQDGLIQCISKKVPVLLSSGSVKLVIIDSIAAHFRSDYEGHEVFKRAKHINSIGTQLHRYSQQYNIPIVCINQVCLVTSKYLKFPSLWSFPSGLAQIKLDLYRWLVAKNFVFKK